MDGHYIEIHGPGSEPEVLEALGRLLHPASIELAEHCAPLVTLRGGRTIVFVDAPTGPGGPVVLAIGNLDHDDEARERAAELILEALDSGTSWRLSGSFDAVSPGIRATSRAGQIATNVRTAVGIRTRYITRSGAFAWRPVHSGRP